MEEKRWESCNAEALLEEFFSQDDLRQLALSTGELLGCPLLVLDDTFHIAAHHLPLGFSDALFETAVRRGEISYGAGAIISRNPMLTAGWADYVQLADSPYRRRFAPLVSAGVRLGCTFIASKLTTHASPFAFRMRSINYLLNQRQYRWRHGLVKM